MPSSRRHHLRGAPLFHLALAAAVGILVGHFLYKYSSGLAFANGGVLLLLGGFLALCFTRNRATLGIALAVVGGFSLVHTLQLKSLETYPYAAEIEAGEALVIAGKGTVTSLSRSASGTAGRSAYRVSIDELTYLDSTLAPSCSVRLLCRRDDLSRGDEISFTGSYRKPFPPRNPGSFDANTQLALSGMVAEVTCTKSGEPILDGRTPLGHLFALAAKTRLSISERITRHLDDTPNAAAVIRAMVLGDRSGAPASLMLEFRESGTLHLFAVSGLHVGIFGMILWSVLRLFRVPHRLSIFIVIPGILFYAFVTGLSPSAVRASVMGSLVLAGLVIGRRGNLANSLGAAALLMLAINTFQLFAIGFQLSFTVLIAILLILPLIRRPFDSWVAEDPFIPQQLLSFNQRRGVKYRRRFADMLCVSLAASLGSTPLALYHFSLATPSAIFANLLLVPAAFGVLFTAFSSLIASIFFPPLSLVLNTINCYLATFITAVATWFAGIPGGHFYLRSDRIDSSSIDQPLARITILDIPFGAAAAHVEIEGADWLIDTGPARSPAPTVVPYLRSQGITRLTGVFLSHGDTAHIGGSSDVFREFRPESVYRPNNRTNSPAEPRLDQSLAALNLTVTPFVGGDSVSLSPDSPKITCLYPPSDLHLSLSDDRCGIFLLELYGFRILFMNDAGFRSEKYLLTLPPSEIKADIIVKGQHTDDHSGLPGFLTAVAPQALVCTNLPFPEGQAYPKDWDSMVRSKGIHLLEQNRTGAITIELWPDRIEAIPHLPSSKPTSFPKTKTLPTSSQSH